MTGFVIEVRNSSKKAILSFFAALTVASFIFMLGCQSKQEGSELALTPGELALTYFGLVIFSPLVETFVLAVLFRICAYKLTYHYSKAIAALIIALSHGLVWWGWALVMIVPFQIFAGPFGRYDLTFQQAYVRSAMTHAFHNLYVLVVLTALYIVGE